LLEQQGRRELGQRFEEALAELDRRLADIPEDLYTAVETTPDRVETARVQAHETLTLIKRDLVPALGVPIQFSDSDGD
jgi:hypothetical protein